MTTLIVKGAGAEAKRFVDYARTLPFVAVEEEKKLRPCVVASIKKSMRGEDVIYSDSVDDMLKEIGLL